MRHTRHHSFISWPFIIIIYFLYSPKVARIIAIISTPVLIHLISVDCVPAVANSLISNEANHQLSVFFLCFFSTLVTALGQRLMNNINLDKRPRRVLSFLFSLLLSSYISPRPSFCPSFMLLSLSHPLCPSFYSLLSFFLCPFLLYVPSLCPYPHVSLSLLLCPDIIFLFSYSSFSSLPQSLCHPFHPSLCLTNVGEAWCHRPP